MPEASELWNSRYLGRRKESAVMGDPWLERWRDLLERGRRGRVLELGCGDGRDSRHLAALGLDLVAGDYAEQALELCRRQAPLAELRSIDLRAPLPFADASFPVVLASLCLHYFSWPRTVAILAEIRRCLKPGGFLLGRVNSTRDLHHGARGHLEVEPHLFLVHGELKRFFDREDLERWIGPEWTLHSLEELTVERYHLPKVLWEFVLEKPGG